MSMDPKALTLASERYHQEKQARLRRISDESERLSALYPRLGEIETQMRTTGIAAARAALSGTQEQVQEAIRQVREYSLELQRERAELLSANGYPADYLYAGPKCSLCGDTGYQDGRICSCLRQVYEEEQLRLLADETGLPIPVFPESVRECVQKMPREKWNPKIACCDYAIRFRVGSRSMLMQGASGSGKSNLAASIAHQVIRSGFFVVYEGAISLFSRYDDDHFRRSEETAREIHRYETADLLILDDLGVESYSQFNAAYLFQLLKTRAAADRTTILCTALPLQGDGLTVEKRYSRQIVSRLAGFELVRL